jgi:hypothetical protein
VTTSIYVAMGGGATHILTSTGKGGEFFSHVAGERWDVGLELLSVRKELIKEENEDVR